MNIEKLKRYLETTPQEELEKAWNEIPDMGGPTAGEYVEFMKEMYGMDVDNELKG